MFENLDENLDNLRQFLTKFDNLTILAKIKIVWINREFQETWPKSRFSKILTRIEIFPKYWPKSTFSEFFFLPKSRFFETIDENQGSSKLLNEIKIFENLDQNWD